jgi:hypothetical protein
MVPIEFWPVGRRYNETLAMGFVVFRGGLETVIYVVGAFGWLVLIALSQEADAEQPADFVRTALPVIWDQGAITFVLGALMSYVLLYQSRLVPRWLSTWGLVGAALGIVPPLGGRSATSTPAHRPRVSDRPRRAGSRLCPATAVKSQDVVSLLTPDRQPAMSSGWPPPRSWWRHRSSPWSRAGSSAGRPATRRPARRGSCRRGG